MGYVDRVITVEHQIGVWCSDHEDRYGCWTAVNEYSRPHLGLPAKCNSTCEGTYVTFERDQEYMNRVEVCECGDRRSAQVRYVWGIYYGIYCDRCWAVTPTAETEGRSFDPDYAGEQYDEEEGIPFYDYEGDY